ncbi:hypothetical protein [Sulfurisphaera tokodaii]|uniref:Uncharacterized protein n=1 Tax=Sulfurisphaera tokodaii (strain DSM 16993 / JCM 10545 / NBRC 100140 / 7) TaxID=273063 RepID=Q970E8_SULTO|nr:hypothetical protein [Sulfurisphaera tokodaii]BAB66725.1 hypothetical protein STK_16440 [Sulfurisphaera tokodaii str. 7]
MPLIVFVVILALAISHAFEPDHIVTLRLMKTRRDYAVFGLSHGIGFASIALPLVIILSIIPELELIGDLIGLGFSVVLLYGEIVGKEFEFNVSKSLGSGILQGAFAITPSKLVVAVLASEVGLLLGLTYIVLFVIVSSLTIFLVGFLLSYINVKKDLSRIINICIALVTIIYILLSILKI